MKSPLGSSPVTDSHGIKIVFIRYRQESVKTGFTVILSLKIFHYLSNYLTFLLAVLIQEKKIRLWKRL